MTRECINSLCWSLKHPAAAVVMIQPKTAKSFHIFSLQLLARISLILDDLLCVSECVSQFYL